MVKCIFSLGTIDKKLIIPFLTIIVYMLYILCLNKFPLDDICIHFYYFGVSFGKSFTFFMLYIFNYKGNYKIKNTENKKCTKNNIIDYFFLFLLNLLKNFSLHLDSVFNNDGTDSLCIMEAFEIIIICLITRFCMKYKYCVRHIISLVIFLILSIIMDIMLKSFKSLTSSIIIYVICVSIIEASNYCYIKYMMDVKYHSLYIMIFFCGISEFFLTLIMISLLLIIRNENNKEYILASLEEYDKSKIGQIVIYFLIGLIGEGILYPILEFQTINLFNPNYIFVCYEIGKIANILFYAKNLLDFLSIIPYIFQIVALLFYLEIFEFNFCGLNKDTKKNILLRQKEEININDIDKNDIVVELKYGYFLTNKENENENDIKNELLKEEKNDPSE